MIKATLDFELYFALHKPRTDNALELQFDLSAHAKERPRGGHKTPIRTRKWEEVIGIIAAEQMRDLGIKTVTFPVRARGVIAVPSMRQDFDNIEKSLWDGLQRGEDRHRNYRVLEDDRLIHDYKEMVRCPLRANEQPFIWVKLYPVNQGDQWETL